MRKEKTIFGFIILLLILQSCALFNNRSGELVGVDADTPILTKKEILKRIPKEERYYFDNMVIIPRVSQISHNYCNIKLTENDTTIIRFRKDPSSFESGRLTLPSFYISDHEVTNGEYLEFVDWVINYSIRKLLAQKYPDEYYVSGTKKLKKYQYIRIEQFVLDSLFDLPTEKPLYKSYYKSLYDTIQTNKLVYEYSYFSVEFENGAPKYNWKVKRIHVYPNTLCWVKEFGSLEMSSYMSSDYLTYPAYSNYPVVGVSYEQALAYCDWRTNRINEAILQKAKVDIGEEYFTLDAFMEKDSLNEYEDLLLPPFSLPTIEEWQLSAGANYIDPDYAFKNKTLFDEKGQYLANFGKIEDKNNYLLKDYGENNPKEYAYTSHVKSFPPNDYQIFDINGNVAEWTKSPLIIFDGYNNYNPYPKVEKDSSNTYMIVKGGSWADSPVYLRWRTNTFYNKDKSSARIGFRVVMPILDYFSDRQPVY